jgi:hypothetical protein
LRIGGLASAGTSTSSITWVRNVALARISTSRNLEADCATIFARASRRCIRQGENGSSTGTANRVRHGIVARNLIQPFPGGAGRRPMTWSRRSIAFRRGSRCATDQRSLDVVIKMMG